MKQGILTEHDAFIMGAKETIIEMISGQENSDKIRDFIIREADDNQIMSLLLIQEMPTDVNDYTLTEDYKTLLESDIIFETQYFTNENYKSFLDEVGGLVEGYENILESVLTEAPWEDSVGGRAAPSAKYAKAAKSAEQSTMKGTANLASGGLAKLRQQILNALARVGRKVSRIPGNIWDMAKAAYGRSIKAGQSVGSAISRAMGAVGNFIRNAGRAAGSFGKGIKYGAKFGKDVNKNVTAASRAGSRVGAAVKSVKGGIKTGAGKVGSAAKTAASGIATGAGKVGSAAKTAAGATRTGAMKAGGAVKGAATTVGKFAASHVKPLGAAAGVALAAGASYKAYQKYFSAAAKACANKTGDAKDACMKLARAKAKAAAAQAKG